MCKKYGTRRYKLVNYPIISGSYQVAKPLHDEANKTLQQTIKFIMNHKPEARIPLKYINLSIILAGQLAQAGRVEDAIRLYSDSEEVQK